MVEIGSFCVPVHFGQRVQIRCSSGFTVLALDGGIVTRILGPDSADIRLFSTDVPRGTSHIQVDVNDEKATVSYQLFDVPSRFEDVDKTPLEIPLSAERPESLQDMMARMISEQFLQLKRQDAAESFEEADDFDIDDEHDPISAYEIQEMVEEEPIPPSSLPNNTASQPAQEPEAPVQEPEQASPKAAAQ